MNQNLKHIQLFEEMVSNSNESGIFTPLIKLKEVVEQATSFNDYQKGITTINTYLSNNDEDIASSLDAISKLPGFGNSKMINVYSLMFPFIEKWGSEMIDKDISSNIELDTDQIEINEPKSDLDDIDLGDIEIDD
jgi:hypothetical protein